MCTAIHCDTCCISGSLGGDIGVVLSVCLSMTGTAQWGMRQSAEMENMMTSVERIQEYGKLEEEAPLETEKGNKVIL